MADEESDNEEGKTKNARQKGGFALVELSQEEDGNGRVLTILVSDLDGQKETLAALTELIDKDEVKGDGERTFGIVQIKRLDLCPKVTRKVTF